MLYTALRHRLEYQHYTIQEVIKKASPRRLQLSPQAGKWNIHDHITHLASYQLAFINRIETILQQDHPSFERYVAEEDPEFENWRTWDIGHLLNRLYADRNHILHRISHLTDNQLSRIGVHKKYGPLTLVQWTEFFLLHEAHHIFTIFQLMHDTELKEN